MIKIISIDCVDNFICPNNVSIRDAMARITGMDYQFQIVVDENTKAIGTLTDGDIRRAILRGVTPDDPVKACMNINPITGYIGEDAENERKLIRLHEVEGGHANFLPIVGSDGVLGSILIHEFRETQSPSALIMAGGLGSRLGELTRTTPKPLLCVGNKPILEHIIERLELSNINDIYISICYLPEKIESYINSRDGEAKIRLVYETEALGTAGSIGLLPESFKSPLLVLNGDVLTSTDFGALYSFHIRHDYDATIAVAQHRVQIPFGVVQHSEDGLFMGINEKPCQEYFIAAGIYLISPEFRSLIPPKERFDMPALLNKGRNLGLKIGLFPIHEYWADIGQPYDFELANIKYQKG